MGLGLDSKCCKILRRMARDPKLVYHIRDLDLPAWLNAGFNSLPESEIVNALSKKNYIKRQENDWSYCITLRGRLASLVYPLFLQD